MKRFWLSWNEYSEDYRPVIDPPNRAVLAWWCSGEDGAGRYSTLVALVEAPTEREAKEAILADWPRHLDMEDQGREWRFCNEVGFDYRPGDRFKINKGWALERVEGRR